MSRYYRAVAVDYDGTLTETDTPHPDVLAAIRRARGGGRLVVLVTGRILDSLLTSFPEAELAFDAMVGENGGVIWLPGKGRRAVAQPVAGELDAALAARGVPVERGSVLLATQAAYDHVVLEEIARRGLDVQLVRNRGALMLLPPGVSKGTGLLEALAELGVSGHSTIAVGDAENDHSLVESCELGVATGAVAGSMADFHHEIARAAVEVLRHHASNRDFSRWTEDVIRDHALAERIRSVEERLRRNGSSASEAGRRLLLEAIETHYQGR